MQELLDIFAPFTAVDFIDYCDKKQELSIIQKNLEPYTIRLRGRILMMLRFLSLLGRKDKENKTINITNYRGDIEILCTDIFNDLLEISFDEIVYILSLKDTLFLDMKKEYEAILEEKKQAAVNVSKAALAAEEERDRKEYQRLKAKFELSPVREKRI